MLEDSGSGAPRLLLFDGREHRLASAHRALASLGVVVASPDDDEEGIEPSAEDVIAVVVSDSQADNHDLSRVERIVTRLREVNDVPVLVLAATVDDDLLLQEYRPGGNSRCSRPVALDFAERVRALLRSESSDIVAFGALEIDRRGRSVRVDSELINLTPREFDLLDFLASSPRRAFGREELLKAVWLSSAQWQSPATVTEHMRRLRLKLEPDPGRPRWLVTVRSVGYRFEA